MARRWSESGQGAKPDNASRRLVGVTDSCFVEGACACDCGFLVRFGFTLQAGARASGGVALRSTFDALRRLTGLLFHCHPVISPFLLILESCSSSHQHCYHHTTHTTLHTTTHSHDYLRSGQSPITASLGPSSTSHRLSPGDLATNSRDIITPALLQVNTCT